MHVWKWYSLVEGYTTLPVGNGCTHNLADFIQGESECTEDVYHDVYSSFSLESRLPQMCE